MLIDLKDMYIQKKKKNDQLQWNLETLFSRRDNKVLPPVYSGSYKTGWFDFCLLDFSSS